MTKGGRGGLANRMRGQLIGAIDVGELRGGERLPSIRRLARELGEDPRRVAVAYRKLEREGLVEIRARSGIFAVPAETTEPGLAEADWVAELLSEAFDRGVALPRLPGLLRACIATGARCAFLDSCVDVVEVFSRELREGFGFQVRPIVGGAPSARDLEGTELLVTTLFHAAAARPLVESLGVPLVVATIHDAVAGAVRRQLDRGALTVVCADPGFGERIRLRYREHIRSADQVRVVPVEDRRAIAALDRKQPVLLTYAARRRLHPVDLRAIRLPRPLIAPRTALELSRMLVRRTLGRAAR